jgi:DNA-binding NtrC family response regulator
MAPPHRDRVLIVDDEVEVANCLRRLLRRHFQVEIACSGEEALQRLERFDADVVVSDFRMAEMSGRELLCRVHERRPDAIRVLMSGWADPMAVDSSVHDGTANRFLFKPFATDDLRAAIQDLLDQRSKRVGS